MVIRLGNRMDLRRLRRRAIAAAAQEAGAAATSVYLYHVVNASGSSMTVDLSGVGQYSSLPFAAVSMERAPTFNLLPFATVSMERTATHDLVTLV